MTAVEHTDVLVVGSGFGGAIAAYHLAAGGARVEVLERGPWLSAGEFDHDFKLGSSYTRIFDFVVGDGMSVLGGNCVGGGSVVYFATMPRAPRFVFERRGQIGRRIWPAAITRDALEPWYDRVVEALPVTQQSWEHVPYAGGLFAAAVLGVGDVGEEQGGGHRHPDGEQEAGGGEVPRRRTSHAAILGKSGVR